MFKKLAKSFLEIDPLPSAILLETLIPAPRSCSANLYNLFSSSLSAISNNLSANSMASFQISKLWNLNCPIATSYNASSPCSLRLAPCPSCIFALLRSALWRCVIGYWQNNHYTNNHYTNNENSLHPAPCAMLPALCALPQSAYALPKFTDIPYREPCKEHPAHCPHFSDKLDIIVMGELKKAPMLSKCTIFWKNI